MLIETTNKADLRLTSLLPNLANTSVISAKLKKKKKSCFSSTRCEGISADGHYRLFGKTKGNL